MDLLADFRDLGFAFGILPNLLVDVVGDDQADDAEERRHEGVKAHCGLPEGPCETAEL